MRERFLPCSPRVLRLDARQGHVFDVLAGGDGKEVVESLRRFGSTARVEQRELQRRVVNRGIWIPLSLKSLRLVHVRQCEVTLCEELAFAVAIFPVEFVILQRVGREFADGLAARGDFKTAGLV